MKRNQNLKIWKIISLSELQKIRKHILKRTPRVWLAYQSITSLWYHISRWYQFELKGIKTGKNERRLLNSLSSSSRKLELFGCECSLFFKGRGKCLLIKGNLEMNGAGALVYTGSMASTQSHELGLLSGAMEDGMGPLPSSSAEAGLQPHWSLLWRQSIEPKMNILGP